MKYFPQPTVTRFEQLSAGALFFIGFGDARTVALKAVDDERDGDTLLVVLGPKVADDVAPGLLMTWQAATVVSFGSEFTVKLPVDASSWSQLAPSGDKLALYLAEGELYVVAHFSRGGIGRLAPCFVRMRDGYVIYNKQMPLGSYALDWSIVLEDEHGVAHTVVNSGISKREADA